MSAHRPPLHLSRRLLLVAGISALALPAGAASSKPPVQVWKDPQCGCCQDWVAHLEQAGFQVKVHATGNAEARQRLGMPAALGSCHTAEVAGYAIEGHVPAQDILRLLRDKPVAVGLSVPGMPVGSPGMDGPVYQGRKDPFDVLLVGRDKRTSVYRRYA